MNNAEIQKVRKDAESQGMVLSQQEFDIILAHTRRKIELNGKSEDYLPLLLENEIRDYFFRCTINTATFLMLAFEQTQNKGGLINGTNHH